MVPSNGNKRLLAIFRQDRISSVTQNIANVATIGIAAAVRVCLAVLRSAIRLTARTRRWMRRDGPYIVVGAAVLVCLTLAVLWTLDRLAQGDERRIEERAWAIYRQNTSCPAATASQQGNTDWLVSRRECLPEVSLGLRRDRASR